MGKNMENEVDNWLIWLLQGLCNISEYPHSVPTILLGFPVTVWSPHVTPSATSSALTPKLKPYTL